MFRVAGSEDWWACAKEARDFYKRKVAVKASVATLMTEQCERRDPYYNELRLLKTGWTTFVDKVSLAHW
jgi:hypothetical protein